MWAFNACLSVASTAAKFFSAHDPDAQSKPGNWFGGAEASEKARIQLSEVDWDVGVCGLEDVTADLDFDSLGGHHKRNAHRLHEGQRDVHHWQFYSSLGHLYASAREELRRIFDAIYGALETDVEGLGGFHADMLPSFTPVCLSASRTASLDSNRRLSLSVEKTSTLIETLHKKVSERRLTSQRGGSVGSEAQLSDVEGMPSWMTRAGLASTPQHSQKNALMQTQLSMPNSPHGSASFVSIPSQTGSHQEDEKGEAETEMGSVISYETAMTPLTESQMGEVNLTVRSVAGSSFYGASRSEGALSSIDQPLTRSATRTETQSPKSLASHAVRHWKCILIKAVFSWADLGSIPKRAATRIKARMPSRS